MTQRDRAEKKVHDKHGSAGDWASGGWGPGGHSDGVNTEHRKAHKAAAKKAKRARRRLDKAIIDEVFDEYGPLNYEEFCQRLGHRLGIDEDSSDGS